MLLLEGIRNLKKANSRLAQISSKLVLKAKLTSRVPRSAQKPISAILVSAQLQISSTLAFLEMPTSGTAILTIGQSSEMRRLVEKYLLPTPLL